MLTLKYMLKSLRLENLKSSSLLEKKDKSEKGIATVRIGKDPETGEYKIFLESSTN